MKNLEKLVAIPSFENCEEILEYLKGRLENKVQELQILGTDKKILLAGLNTNLQNIEPISLSGHIDTVSANVQLYNSNPFVLTQLGGKAYGLGSIDMKSFTAIVLDNLEKIKSMNYPIIIALTTDEETKLNSIEFLIETLKKLNIKPKLTILGEPTNSKFALCCNAYYSYRVKFYGKSCHSSKIAEGVNAICACAKLISFIESTQTQFRLTSNCGVIKGGEVVNKVPDYAELDFDVRSIYDQDVKAFIEKINQYILLLTKEYVGLLTEMSSTLAMPAFNMLENEKLNKLAKDLNIATASFSGGCEAGYYTDYSGDAVVFGVGDLALAHKPNEYVVVSEYETYSKQLLLVLNKLETLYFE